MDKVREQLIGKELHQNFVASRDGVHFFDLNGKLMEIRRLAKLNINGIAVLPDFEPISGIQCLEDRLELARAISAVSWDGLHKLRAVKGKVRSVCPERPGRMQFEHMMGITGGGRTVGMPFIP